MDKSLRHMIEKQRQFLAVMESAEAGFQVQKRIIHGVWYDDDDPDFNPKFEWRVRPVPKTFTVNEGKKVRVHSKSGKIVVFYQINHDQFKLFEKDEFNRFDDITFRCGEEIPFGEFYNGNKFFPVED